MQHSKFATISAKTFSYIFHPLIIPTIGCILIFNSGYYLDFLAPSIKHSVYVIVFILTFALPIIIIPALYFQRIITSIYLEKRNERILPMLIVIIMYILSYYFMHKAGFPPLLLKYLAGCISGIAVSLIITTKWKISLHTTALGGITALIVFLSFSFGLPLYTHLSTAIIVAGIAGTSRIITKSHTPLQVYAGFISGFVCVSLPMFIM